MRFVLIIGLERTKLVRMLEHRTGESSRTRTRIQITHLFTANLKQKGERQGEKT